jgi:2'-5' RNA ligase
MKTVRAFIALPLSGPVFERICQLRRRLVEALPDVRWMRPETLHLTLAFLGDIPEESLERIAGSMLSIGDVFAPVDITVDGIGAFPSLTRPRVVWLGVDGGETLSDLNAAVTTALRALDLPCDDRPFRPHLTLGRVRRPATDMGRTLRALGAARCGTLQCGRLVLFESRLGPGGARHYARREAALTGTTAI